MSKVNTMEQDNIYVRYSIIIVGITIMSIGVNEFLIGKYIGETSRKFNK